MCQASWGCIKSTPARSADYGRRAFFVPSIKCQARVLECQALKAKTLGAGGWWLGALLYWLTSSKRWWR